MKKCSKCKQTKSVDSFNKNRAQKDGLQCYCKHCRKGDNRWKYWSKESYRKYRRINYKRRKIDINYRLRINLRARLGVAIKNTQKSGSAIKDLGCSIEQLKVYLKEQFQEGMSWDNYGKWHIDHIVPLASFDLSNYSQFQQACHYTNLQPLWAIDNFKKGCLID